MEKENEIHILFHDSLRSFSIIPQSRRWRVLIEENINTREFQMKLFDLSLGDGGENWQEKVKNNPAQKPGMEAELRILDLDQMDFGEGLQFLVP